MSNIVSMSVSCEMNGGLHLLFLVVDTQLSRRFSRLTENVKAYGYKSIPLAMRSVEVVASLGGPLWLACIVFLASIAMRRR